MQGDEGRKSVQARISLEVLEEGRVCYTCKEFKLWKEYHKFYKGVNGHHPTCKGCSSARLAAVQYNITVEQFQLLYSSCGNLCELCGCPETSKDHRSSRIRRLAIDHDHNCCPGSYSCGNCIRGLLCGECNKLVGIMEKKPILMSNIVKEYLSSPKKFGIDISDSDSDSDSK